MSAILLISSMRLIVLFLECTTIGFDVLLAGIEQSQINSTIGKFCLEWLQSLNIVELDPSLLISISNGSYIKNLLRVTMETGGTERIGLPKCRLAELRTINRWINSNANFEISIIDFVPFFQANPTSGDYNDERDGADSSSRMSFSQMTHRLGLFLKPILLWVITTSEWLASGDLVYCHLIQCSMVEVELVKRNLALSGYYHKSEVQPIGSLQWWFRIVECKFC